MKAKIFVLLLAVLLVLGSFSFASGLKHFEGWVQQIGDSIPIDPYDYPYLAQVVDQHPGQAPLFPPWLTTFYGINNVGGASIHKNAQLFYWDFVSPTIEFFEDSTVTVANGDQIFITVEGLYDIATGTVTATDTVVGGTGSFNGAKGSLQASAEYFYDSTLYGIALDGYIKTACRNKKH
jgi:hypothetical protein